MSETKVLPWLMPFPPPSLFGCYFPNSKSDFPGLWELEEPLGPSSVSNGLAYGVSLEQGW